MKKKPRVIDAEFTVVSDPREPRKAWYQRLWEDHPAVVIIFGLALYAAAPTLTDLLSGG